VRHKWKPLDARNAVCERCGAGRLLIKRPGEIDLYDDFFRYPKGGVLFLDRGVKIPPCDGVPIQSTLSTADEVDQLLIDFVTSCPSAFDPETKED
jgi:hypothetical protein